MIYAIVIIAAILGLFFIYIIGSIYAVYSTVRRIEKNRAASIDIEKELRICQRKMVCALKEGDYHCTLNENMYFSSEDAVTAHALKTVDRQMKFYFDKKPGMIKKEAVYQHSVAYNRFLSEFQKNEEERIKWYNRMEDLRKSRLYGGFAEAAIDKLPKKDETYQNILGFGLMRLPLLENGDVDLEQCIAMADCMMQHGFRYFDTAYFYLDGRSEGIAKKILVDRYHRGTFLLADKMPVSLLKEDADVERIFNEQLERTGAKYFDYYLLHALNNNTYEKQSKRHKVFQFISEKKKQGIVRQMGFSFHDKPEVLEKILNENPEVDFVQLQLNYYDWESKDVAARRCYEVARAHGKPIVVMEPIKGGNLAVMPQEIRDKLPESIRSESLANLALRFVASKEGILTVLSGMSTLAQAFENAENMTDMKPLTDAETQALLQAAEEIRKIPTYPCTRCRYCLEVCPSKLPIPQIITKMNHRMRGGTVEIPEAQACVSCGACEAKCPQRIKIRQVMAQAVKTNTAP